MPNFPLNIMIHPADMYKLQMPKLCIEQDHGWIAADIGRGCYSNDDCEIDPYRCMLKQYKVIPNYDTCGEFHCFSIYLSNLIYNFSGSWIIRFNVVFMV